MSSSSLSSAVCNHTRVMSISAATRENVTDLMRRVRKFVDAAEKQEREFADGSAGNLLQGEERVSFDDDDDEDESFQVLTDVNYPGQFRVTGPRIERVSYSLLR